ncbi:Cytoplasmic protein nck2, partial [Podila epigama]
YVKLIEKKEEGDVDKPTKFKLAAFGVKQGGLGSLFAGGVIPGLKKTGGLKKMGIDTTSSSHASPPVAAAPAAPAPAPARASSFKRTSVDEPRSPIVHQATPPKLPSAPVAEQVPTPLVAPTPVRAPPVPVEEVAASPEPRIPSRAKKPKAKQVKAIVVYEYSAQEDDEISLVKGSTVVVTDKMGDEGWWCGRNEDGQIGNFPSDFVQEIKEDEPKALSPVVVAAPLPVPAAVFEPEPAPAPAPAPAPVSEQTTPKSPQQSRRPLPVPVPAAVFEPEPAPAPAPAPAPVSEQITPKSPQQSRRPLPVPVPAVSAVPEVVVPAEPKRTDLPRTRTNEGVPLVPLATPSSLPRTSRPPSMIGSPTYPPASDIRALSDGPPLPASPPPKRMSIASRSNSHDNPSSPRPVSVVLPGIDASSHAEVTSPTSIHAPPVPVPGELSRSSTLRRPHKPVPEAPLNEVDEQPEPHFSAEAPIDHEQTTVRSNRSSYILPSPVSRSRPLPPLARPPSVHSIIENRKSVVSPHLPAVSNETEEPTVAVTEQEQEQEVVEVQVANEPERLEHNAPAEKEEEEEEEEEEKGVVTVEPVVAKQDVASNIESPEKEVNQESQQEVEQEISVTEGKDDVNEPVAVEEKEPEKPKLPEVESSGPVLSHASRPRPAKGRKLPTVPVANAEDSFASQIEAEVKAAPIVEETKPEPAPTAPVSAEKAAPPPKPVKPIFSKFPTPFAGVQPVNIALRPTGRRAQSSDSPQSPGAETTTAAATTTTTSSGPGAVSTPPLGGVKSLSSRFGQFQGVPASGGNNAQVELEIAKLKRWVTDEVDRLKRDLAEEREHRQKLERQVEALKAQLQG